MKLKLGRHAILAGLCMFYVGAATAATSHFSKVPADTPIYIGTTADEDWLVSLGLGDAESLRLALAKLAKSKSANSEDLADESRFLQVIAEAMLQGGVGGTELVAQPGRVQFYLQGAAPVVRLQLSSGKQFQAFLEEQAAEDSAAVQTASIQGQDMWVPAGVKAEVFAAVDGNDLVLSRWNQGPGYPSFKDLVSGGQGFDATNNLQPAMEKYNVSGSTVGWLDLEQLQSSIVNPEHALHQAIKAQVSDEAQWQQFLGAQCQADVSRFISNTPHAIGAVQYAHTEQQRLMKSAFVWPMLNDKARAAWQSLQGLVLTDSAEHAPFRMGLGVNGQGVSTFVNYIASDLAALQCPLWRDQAAQAGVGLAMASSMSAMFSSVKGVTAQLFDFTLDTQNNPVPDSVDAQLTVLTDSPSLLLLMLRSTLTLPASIPEDGTPVSVDTPFGVPVQLAVYPHSINVFKGESAALSVAELKNSVQTESSVLSYALDFYWAMSKSGKTQQGKTPEEMLRESGADAMVPLSASGGMRHLPYGMRIESNAIYAHPEKEKQPEPAVVKASN